jgi:hypothetical protein
MSPSQPVVRIGLEERDLARLQRRRRAHLSVSRPEPRATPTDGRWRRSESRSTSAGISSVSGGRFATPAEIPMRRRLDDPTSWSATKQ